MKDMQRRVEPERLRQEIGLFRYGLISDLKDLPQGSKGLYAKLKQKAEHQYTIPGSTRVRVAAETIRDWLQMYRKGGFDALLPKERKDAGRSHALPQEVADLLMATKEEHPELTVAQVIGKVRQEEKVPAEQALPVSTVHRLLARHGLTAKRKEPEGSTKDHRRFQFQKAGELWMSDVMHGPAVVTEGKAKRKAYLIAFIDDATRVVPYAAFTFAENIEAFLGVLKQALQRRGIPLRLFVDNGSAFRCHRLELICAKLGITLIHARPYHPQAKGKMERWFLTVRLQLLPLLTPEDLRSLEALNRRLWAYIEGEYHQTPHRGLDGQTPLDRWAMTADEVRHVKPQLDLDDLFLEEARRRVQKDRTVCLNGRVYEVEAALVGETVMLRFDPSRPGRPIQVWAEGKHVHDARLVDAYANCFVRRSRPALTLEPSMAANGQDPGSAMPLPLVSDNSTPVEEASSRRTAPKPPAGMPLAELALRSPCAPGDDEEGR